MYKTLSKNLQRARERSQGRASGLSLKAKAKSLRQAVVDRIERDVAKILSPHYLSKLGGWRAERFADAGAKFQLVCKQCTYRSSAMKPAEFARKFARAPEGTQLLKIKKLIKCPKCTTRRIFIRIHIGRRQVDFGRKSVKLVNPPIRRQLRRP